jgi:hypothetical protein
MPRGHPHLRRVSVSKADLIEALTAKKILRGW